MEMADTMQCGFMLRVSKVEVRMTLTVAAGPVDEDVAYQQLRW